MVHHLGFIYNYLLKIVFCNKNYFFSVIIIGEFMKDILEIKQEYNSILIEKIFSIEKVVIEIF